MSTRTATRKSLPKRTSYKLVDEAGNHLFRLTLGKRLSEKLTATFPDEKERGEVIVHAIRWYVAEKRASMKPAAVTVTT